MYLADTHVDCWRIHVMGPNEMKCEKAEETTCNRTETETETEAKQEQHDINKPLRRRNNGHCEIQMYLHTTIGGYIACARHVNDMSDVVLKQFASLKPQNIRRGGQ